MFVRVLTGAALGIKGHLVSIEVDVGSGMPALLTIGLPQGAVAQGRERVIAALQNSGYLVPPLRITVNVASGDSRSPTSFDLPIAIGVVAATAQLDSVARLGEYLLAGELALDGALRSMPAALPIALAAKHAGLKGIILPQENVAEASLVDGLEVRGATTLAEVIRFLDDTADLPASIYDAGKILEPPTFDGGDFADVRGHEHTKRALEVAAAGHHSVLMVGPPGAGKTMLAQRIPGILPPLSRDEAIEIIKIRSVAGLTASGSMSCARPFRYPHPSVSEPGVIGGGSSPRPGEISLAHCGVLFLDELGEFRRAVLQALRLPLEEGVVTLIRGAQEVVYPCRAMLVAAIHPCTCGWNGDQERRCTCSPADVQKHLTRVAGQLLDRMDLHIEVPAVRHRELTDRRGGEPTEAIQERVARARAIQRERFGASGRPANAHIAEADLARWCPLDDGCDALLRTASTRLGLTPRAYHHIVRVARTIADLDGGRDISAGHVAEAVQYRALDRAIAGGAAAAPLGGPPST